MCRAVHQVGGDEVVGVLDELLRDERSHQVFDGGGRQEQQ